MQESIYNLSDLSANFKKLQSDKKKAVLKPLQFILQLNKNIHIDEILMREGYKNYPNKAEMQKNKAFKVYESFFKYIVESLDSIEEKYLKESDDKELIENADKQNHNQYNFLLNKNNISKFIRDEATYYQTIIDKYLVEKGQQRGIQTKNIHSFFTDLFASKYTMIINDHSSYLQLPPEEISVQIGNTLISYGQQAKEMTLEQAQSQFLVNQQQILDFLTFWLKQKGNNNLFVLYARTKGRLQQQAKILLNKSVVQITVHPSRMSKGEIESVQKQQAEAKEKVVAQEVNVQQNQNIKMQNEQHPYTHEYDDSMPDSKMERVFNNNKIQLLLAKVEEPAQVQADSNKKQPSKQEILSKSMRSLFDFGCKRRYKLNKNSTFDELGNEMKTMNLQKFMYFCNFFELLSLFSKQVIAQSFKAHAINFRTIDYQQFQKIIYALIKTNQKIIDNLTNKLKFQLKSKQNHISHYKKLGGQLSNYKYRIRPVNGKDISTIEMQLSFKKLQKKMVREVKDHKALMKRETLEQPKIIRSKSNFGYSKTKTIQLQPIKEAPFDPQKLIGLDSDHDQLWEAYEAKIWKKEEKSSNSILQSVLSKRIKRGNNIINKINSERFLLYE